MKVKAIYTFILCCESAVCNILIVISHKKVYIHIALLASSFVCKPDYSPNGQRHAAYIKIHTCVSVYIIDYVLNIRSTDWISSIKQIC